MEKLKTAPISLTALATPLLAPRVEVSLGNGHIDTNLLYYYLRQLPLEKLDVFIPGCTHYIFLEDEIKKFFKLYYQKDIEVINTAKLTALAIEQFLHTHVLLSNSPSTSSPCFMVTEYTLAFIQAGK